MSENCSICGIAKELITKSPPKCKTCYSKSYKRPIAVCSKCENLRPVHSRANGVPLCNACYKKTYSPPTKRCTSCGLLRPVKLRSGGGPLCHSCYKQTPVACSCCGDIKEMCAKHNGNSICRNCHNKRLRVEDENFRITALLRQRVNSALRLYSASGKVKGADEYGISYKKIIQHLEPFPKNTDGYHVDHIMPLKAFNLNDPIHIVAAFAPENHQWLTAEENMSKNDKHDEKEFKKYLSKFVKERK